MSNSKESFITLNKAKELLGIKRESLYSYVSRKKIKTIIDPKNGKKRLYSYDDIINLLENKKKAGAEKIARETLVFGQPVLESSITLIEDSILYYRGISIADLVNKNTFEEVALLIWSGNLTLPSNFPNIRTNPHKLAAITIPELEKYFIQLEKEEFISVLSNDLQTLGWKILVSLVQDVTQNYTKNTSIANKLAECFCPEMPHAEELINTALIIIADHELNASSFTARIIASTGGNLFQVIIGALATLSGYKHGGAILQVEQMVKELSENLATIDKNLLKRKNRGDDIVGFGHNLYDKGDFRAKLLLQKISHYYGDSKEFEIYNSIIQRCRNITKQDPTVDFALLTLSSVLKSNSDFALFLFSYGRIAGWIGQAMEQYQEDILIRPRAKYIGPRPKSFKSNTSTKGNL